MLNSLPSQMLVGNLAVQTIGSWRDLKIIAFFKTVLNTWTHIDSYGRRSICEWKWRICPLSLTNSRLSFKKCHFPPIIFRGNNLLLLSGYRKWEKRCREVALQLCIHTINTWEFQSIWNLVSLTHVKMCPNIKVPKIVDPFRFIKEITMYYLVSTL